MNKLQIDIRHWKAALQAGALIYCALLPADRSIAWFVAGLLCHGAGAGVYLAALHRAALDGVPSKQTGAAAGLYSMFRFGGGMLGAAAGGVLLQWGLSRGLPDINAYQLCFGFIGSICLVGFVLAWRLKVSK